MTETPEVRRVRSASFVFGALVPDGTEEPVESLIFAGDPAVSGDRVVDGSAPREDRPGDFCASQGFVDRIGGRLGQEWNLITIRQDEATRLGFDAETVDGPVVRAKLVCTMSGPSELQDGYAIAVFPRSLLDEGDIGIADTPHLVNLAPGGSNSDVQRTLDATSMGPFQVQDTDVVPDDVRTAAQARAIGVAIVAVAALVVGGQSVTRRYRVANVIGPVVLVFSVVAWVAVAARPEAVEASGRPGPLDLIAGRLRPLPASHPIPRHCG